LKALAPTGEGPAELYLDGNVGVAQTHDEFVALVERLFPSSKVVDRMRVSADLPKARAFAQLAIKAKFGEVKRLHFVWRGKTDTVSMDGVLYQGGLFATLQAAFAQVPEKQRGPFTVREVPRPSVEPGKLKADIAAFLAGKSIEFETGGDKLTAPSQQALDGVLSLLKDVKGVDIEVQVHTDNVGDRTANLQLSRGRAEAVKAYLATKGADAKRLRARGFGDGRPLAPNDTPANQAKNRRTEFDVREQE
jgi:OOP family OmpA-OmpF porin